MKASQLCKELGQINIMDGSYNGTVFSRYFCSGCGICGNCGIAMLCFTTSSAMVTIVFLSVFRQRCTVVPVSQPAGMVAIFLCFTRQIRQRCGCYDFTTSATLVNVLELMSNRRI